MISVLTLTYKRHHLLEEAIESFLRQELPPQCEMVIINDNAEVHYKLDHPNVRIINHKERFSSIGAKLEWGYKQCKYNYIYRLDDDDLLTPWALANTAQDILENPTYDIYRSDGMWLFENNKYVGKSSNVNNGNVYTKIFLDGIKFPLTSFGEDVTITHYSGGRIYQSKLPYTMIYRWGMNTSHISGLGEMSNEDINEKADEILNYTSKGIVKGIVQLEPKFLNDYYTDIKKSPN